MKALAMLLTILVLSSASATAQSQQADLLKDLPQVPLDKVERYVQFQSSTLNKVFGVNVQYTGVLPLIRKADRPLQLINPFAPARYGDAFENVSINPLTGRPEGIVIFAIRF
jgi:hypothetical protein